MQFRPDEGAAPVANGAVGIARRRAADGAGPAADAVRLRAPAPAPSGADVIAGRYLVREILSMTAAILAVLLLVTIGGRLSGYLADAAVGRLSASAVLSIMGLRLPEFIALLLPLSFFLGLLLAFARLQAGSEITVLRAAGLGDDWFARRALAPALAIGVLVAGLTLVLVPLANARIEAVFEATRGVQALGNLVPGQFAPLGRDGRMARIGGIDADTGALSDVLLIEIDDRGGRSIVVADRGRVRMDPVSGRRVLQLGAGERHDLGADDVLHRSRFRELEQWIDAAVGERPPADAEARSTLALLGDEGAEARAELHWRLALPWLVPVLTLLAIPLCRGDPCSGGRPRVLLALGGFLTLFALLVLGRGAVADGALPPWLGLWTPPLVAALGAVLVLRRLSATAASAAPTAAAIAATAAPTPGTDGP